MTLSCALGWVVAKISLLKHKSFVTVVISLAFFGAYYFFYFRAMALIQELLANLAVYGAAVKDGAYPIYLFGSVGTGDAKACIIVTVFVAALFAIMWALISRSFLKPRLPRERPPGRCTGKPLCGKRAFPRRCLAGNSPISAQVPTICSTAAWVRS